MAKIFKCTSTQIMYVQPPLEETYYFTTDSLTLYRYTSASVFSASCLQKVDYVFVETEIQRAKEIIPAINTDYYVWETNTLWTYQQGQWVLKAGAFNYNNSYYYNTGNSVSAIETGYEDVNGLLHDGSVVIRDMYGLVKGRLFVDPITNNLAVSSYTGGGISFFPCAVTDTIQTVPDPIFYYEKDETGAYVLDENGNRIIQEVQQLEDYGTPPSGRLDVTIENDYDGSGNIIDKKVYYKIGENFGISEDDVTDGRLVLVKQYDYQEVNVDTDGDRTNVSVDGTTIIYIIKNDNDFYEVRLESDDKLLATYLRKDSAIRFARGKLMWAPHDFSVDIGKGTNIYTKVYGGIAFNGDVVAEHLITD